LSKEDYNSSEPSGNERIYFDSSEDVGTEPYLSFTYTAATTKESQRIPFGGGKFGGSKAFTGKWGN
jgi:hypothetical protein